MPAKRVATKVAAPLLALRSQPKRSPSISLSASNRIVPRTLQLQKKTFSLSRGFTAAAPRAGAKVEKYRKISVLCSKCGNTLFRYHKRNGTKSNLVKMFVERICGDPAGILAARKDPNHLAESECSCPECQTCFGRPAIIKGRQAIKLIGNRARAK